MSSRGHKTVIVSVRVSRRVLEVIQRRAKANCLTVSKYLGERIAYDVLRKHHKRKGQDSQPLK